MGKPTTEERSKITSALIKTVDIPEPELSKDQLGIAQFLSLHT